MIPVIPKRIDPEKPKFPQFIPPKWLSSELRKTLNNHLEFMKTQKQTPIEIRELFDLYEYLVNIFNKVKNVFIDSRMQPIWEKLNLISEKETIYFAHTLLSRIENDYDGGLTMIEKHKAEAESAERMIAFAQKLHDEMENYQYWFYGHVIQKNHSQLTKTLAKFIKNTSISLDEFKEHIKAKSYMFSKVWPINRQNRDENSLAIFYMRKIYLIFIKSFGKPMYAYIAEIVNVIFNTAYTENHAIKYCKILRPLIHDNSQ